MKKQLKLLTVSAAAAALLLLAACGSGEDSESGNGDVVTVGTEATFAPFESMQGDKIVGFDADLLAAVMEEAGLEYTFENTGWTPMLENVRSGQLDAGVAAVSITDERKETYDFSSPYFEVSQSIVVNEDSDVDAADDLKGLNVGVQNGTTGDTAAQEILGSGSDAISKYDKSASAFMALTNGDVDAVVTDSEVAKEYVANNSDAGVKVVEDKESFPVEYYGFLLPKDSEYKEQLDEALQAVMENGTYEEIYQDWFEGTPDVESLQNAQP